MQINNAFAGLPRGGGIKTALRLAVALRHNSGVGRVNQLYKNGKINLDRGFGLPEKRQL